MPTFSRNLKQTLDRALASARACLAGWDALEKKTRIEIGA